MLYTLAVAALFSLLYGEAAYARAPASAPPVALIGLLGTLAALVVPSLLWAYSDADHAALVMTRLARRGALGSALAAATTVAVYPLGPFTDAGALGELYLYTLLAIFLFHGFGNVVANHVMYLQRTRQYNSNQLVAVLLTVTLLLFFLVLYFLAFDLSRPPDPHAYRRDVLAITLVLIGYGRAVYAMAHH